MFAGSSSGNKTAYLDVAQDLGRILSEHGFGVVYGGASIGLMGAMADAALTGGGEVIGVIPHSIAERELAHSGLTELRLVASMHERKAMMAELADAFIALPGGIGTLEETFEIWTWRQLGIHSKPIGILNAQGFYDSLLSFLDQLVEAEFVRPANREDLLVETTAEALINGILTSLPGSD